MPVEQHYVSELLFLIFFSCLVDRVIMTSPIPTTMAQTAPPVDPIIIWRKAEEWLPPPPFFAAHPQFDFIIHQKC